MREQFQQGIDAHNQIIRVLGIPGGHKCITHLLRWTVKARLQPASSLGGWRVGPQGIGKSVMGKERSEYFLDLEERASREVQLQDVNQGSNDPESKARWGERG